MKDHFTVPRERLEEFCRRWRIVELAFFGSALPEDFRSDSDLDLLVSFSEDAHHSLLDLVRMQDELALLFGREVDLVERKALEQSRNYIRRKAILHSAEPIYAR